MPETPRFSVTIPAYNAALTLEETLESVLAQTYSDFEIVVVDDGSTDATLALAGAFAKRDRRIRVLHQENRGSGGAYNTAVRAALGELCVMLSSDDLLLPDHLASFNEFIEGNSDAAVFTCNGWYEYEDGRRELARPECRWADASECKLTDLLSACFYGVGAVYRREVFEVVGGFREDIYAEDYLFWLLALAHGYKHRHLRKPLSVHRRWSLQKSANALKVRETDVRVIEELIKSGLLSELELARAQEAQSRLKRNIRIRRALASAVGDKNSERIIAMARRLNSPKGAAK